MLTISLNYSINHTTDEMQRGTVGEQDLIEVDHIAKKSNNSVAKTAYSRRWPVLQKAYRMP